MNGIRHPFTGALYERTSDGSVKVTLDERDGIFTKDGQWRSGELREADPQLCGWVAGARVASRRAPEKVDGNGARSAR